MGTSWTWLVYMVTHDDVQRYGERSIGQMRQAQLGDEVRVLVHQDISSGCVRREIGAAPDEVVADLGSVDSGDPAMLLDFIKWGVAQAPAERYALVLWSHGTGWQPPKIEQIAKEHPAQVPVSASELRQRGEAGSLCQVFFSTTLRRLLSQPTPSDRAIATDTGAGHGIDTLELGQAMAQAATILGKPLDLLAMNACQMASVEVAYQIRQHVGIYVATEEYMPALGLPYDDILSRLGAKPAMDAAQLGRIIVERYCASFDTPEMKAQLPWGQPVGKITFPPGATLAALDLRGMERVAEAAQALSAALRADMNSQYDALWEAAEKAKPFGEFHLYDMVSLCQPLAAHQAASADSRDAALVLLAALADPALLLAREYTAPVYANLGGLTTYVILPDADGRNKVSPYYAETAYAQQTAWDGLLSACYTV
jgi:hypothetical protein